MSDLQIKITEFLYLKYLNFKLKYMNFKLKLLKFKLK